jgi:hypothetical protein
MDLERGLVLVVTLVIGSVALAVVVPTFIPAIKGLNSHSLQIGQVATNATVHISIPSRSLYYVCILPIVYSGPVYSTNPVPTPDPSHAIFIDPANSTLCHQVNG